MSAETITILRDEYERLVEREEFLSALEAAGVDNWCGFDEAHSIMREWAEEDKKKNET